MAAQWSYATPKRKGKRALKSINLSHQNGVFQWAAFSGLTRHHSEKTHEAINI